MNLVVRTKSGLNMKTNSYRYESDLLEAIEKVKEESDFIRIGNNIVRISEIEAIIPKF